MLFRSNSKLTYNDEKIIGWVFSKKHKEKITHYLNTGIIDSNSIKKSSNDSFDIDFIMNKIANLESRIKELEENGSAIPNIESNVQVPSTKRLLKKK